MPTDRAAIEEGEAWTAALEGCSLLDAIGANVDLDSFLAGVTTPVFVGSALTNFGVRMLLDAVIDLAPPAVARQNIAVIRKHLITSSRRLSSRFKPT